MRDILLAALSGSTSAGYYWDEALAERIDNPLCLEKYGYKVYSQNDEDGILAEIFNRIGTASKRFIEFGVEDGTESNSHLLLHKGWKGLWLEGDKDSYQSIQQKFRLLIENQQLQVVNSYVTKENVNDLFEANGFKGEIDLLSIDIDGNDYHVLEAVTIVNPRVIAIEYNGKFPPDVSWTMAYNQFYRWNETDCHGASLKALTDLCMEKGYQLAGTNMMGVNAFFVRKDLALNNLFITPAAAENLYNPLRLWMSYRNGHPSKTCLAVQKDGIEGMFAQLPKSQIFFSLSGFHNAEYDSNGNFSIQWMSAKQALLFVRTDDRQTEPIIPQSA